MKVSAIVPVWNGRALLDRLLTTLEAQTVRADELLVVDNGSDDGAPEMARERGARVIAMGRNAGFAPAVNRGIRESRGEWVAVLNSDVELAEDYLERLLEANAWLATGKILKSGSGEIDGTFDVVCRGGTAWRVGNGRADGPLFSEARTIESPPWTAALFRAEVFRRVGYLEESFESYLEDVDFGLRCAAMGIAGQYVPRAVAWHRGSASLGRWHARTVQHMARNQILLVARHYAGRDLRRCAWPIVAAQVLWGAVALRHGAALGWMRGVWQGMRGFRGARPKGDRFDPLLLERLRANEHTIRRVLSESGFDGYWRLYLLLTHGGSK